MAKFRLNTRRQETQQKEDQHEERMKKYKKKCTSCTTYKSNVPTRVDHLYSVRY